MKTLLTICGQTLQLPKASTSNLAQLLELLNGATEVHNRTIYGPEGEKKFSREYYRSVEVVENRPAKIRLEQLHDDEVLSEQEFAALQKETADRIAKDFLAKDLPQADSVARSE